jgi:hypothetical protein
MPRITLTDVESSQIHSIGHDAETNTLAIRFTRGYGPKRGPGSLYHYQNFTRQDFEAFAGAESLGKHFGAHIKNEVVKYPFEKIVETSDEQPLAA